MKVLGALASLALVSGAATVRAEEARTLDDITIEGEIAMPQVLFITAREQYRYEDEFHHLYFLDAKTLAERSALPRGIWVGGVADWIGTSVTEAHDSDESDKLDSGTSGDTGVDSGADSDADSDAEDGSR